MEGAGGIATAAVSAVAESLALAKQASEVRKLLQEQRQQQLATHGERSVVDDSVAFRERVQTVRGEVTALLERLHEAEAENQQAEAENQQLREDAVVQIALVRVVSERVGSLKQLELSDVAAATDAARLGGTQRELSEAQHEAAGLRDALDSAVAASERASGEWQAERSEDATSAEALQLDLRHALHSLRCAKEAAAAHDEAHSQAARAAESAAVEPLHAELVAIAQQVHAYEKAALEQSRATDEEAAARAAMAAEGEQLRQEIADHAQELTELRQGTTEQSVAAEALHAELQASNVELQGALNAAMADAAGAIEQLGESQTVAGEAAGLQSANDELRALLDVSLTDVTSAAVRNEEEVAARAAMAAEGEQLRQEIADHAQELTELRQGTTEQSVAAEALHAELQASNVELQGALNAAMADAAGAIEQLGESQTVAGEAAGLQSANDELRALLDVSLTDVTSAAARNYSLQGALETAVSDAGSARERLAESVALAILAADKAAADAAEIESLTYLHAQALPPLPSQAYIDSPGASLKLIASDVSVSSKRDDSSDDDDASSWAPAQEELAQLRRELKESEGKYEQLVEKHAAVAEAATPREKADSSDSDDEVDTSSAGTKRQRTVTGVVDLVAAVSSLRQDRDRSVRVAAGLNRKLSTVMREQRYSQKLIARLRAASPTDEDFGGDTDGDSVVSVASSGISLISQSGGQSPDSQARRKLEAQVGRLHAEISQLKRSEKAMREQVWVGSEKRMVSLEEGQEGDGTDDDGGSSVASFDSALDDGAVALDPREVAATAVVESARLRTELGAARAEGAAALAVEHGRRTAVVEAHRAAHATTIRQTAELQDSHSEIASLRRRLAFEASARAELEQQLSVAIDDAKGLAAEAVSRQRRAAAKATTAEKALFAREELRVLAEAAAAWTGAAGDDSSALMPPEAEAPCRWLLAMGFSRQRCLDALQLAAARSSLSGSSIMNSLDGSTPGTPPGGPPTLGASLLRTTVRRLTPLTAVRLVCACSGVCRRGASCDGDRRLCPRPLHASSDAANGPPPLVTSTHTG